MREQPNIFAACITLGTAATCQKLSYVRFDVHVAVVQYTSRTLFVDFRCSHSNYYRIVSFAYSKYRNDNHPENAV